MKVEDRLGRILKLLQGSIRAAGFTQTEVDERIGRRRGYLSHVFQRRVDLKLVDLLRALDVLQVDPGRFFGAALGGRRSERSATLEDLMSLVVDLRDGGQAASALPIPASVVGSPANESFPKINDDALLDRVRVAVRKVLSNPDEATAKLLAGQNGQSGEPAQRT